MIILIDIGNSRTKFTRLVEGNFSATISISNSDLSAAYFLEHFSDAAQVIVANVATAEHSNNLFTWCEQQAIRFKQVTSEQQKGAVISAYQEPTKLGVDRWLALLAAEHLYPQQNVLIIDAGTATTVDFLAADGQHHGGWILAGINALVESILSHSTLVEAEDNAQPHLGFGLNTSDNVHNASWSATVGLIHQAIKQAQQFGELDVVLLTGGNGNTLAKLLKNDNEQGGHLAEHFQVIDNLIFYGLQQYSIF